MFGCTPLSGAGWRGAIHLEKGIRTPAEERSTSLGISAEALQFLCRFSGCESVVLGDRHLTHPLC
jgi:hypothetical protein